MIYKAITWDAPARIRLGAFLMSVTLLLALVPSLTMAQPSHKMGSTRVIVGGTPGAQQDAARSVRLLGGRVLQSLDLIDGFTAELPAQAQVQLRSLPFIRFVSPDRPVTFQSVVDGYDAAADTYSMFNSARLIGAQGMWSAGITGRGVDVALIDTGVTPVAGLNGPGKIVNGPDISFDSPAPNLRSLDSYGHGTFLAGLIAGHDAGVNPATVTSDASYLGVAPDARIVNVKVGATNGAVDVSQIIVAINWVVSHQQDDGLNIRVLNLSLGTNSNQPYTLDPLAYAAERAWRSGLVVVAASGNGVNGFEQVSNPASDPYVIAVGADDTTGGALLVNHSTPGYAIYEDGHRQPDLVAPANHIQGLGVPGSFVDVNFPAGRINGRYFRGSGTSQAAALTSGAVALILQSNPNLNPDQVKSMLTSTAVRLPNGHPTSQGSGLLQLRPGTAATSQSFAAAAGTGTLEGARGGVHVTLNGTTLTGERDIFGRTWNAATTGQTMLAGGTWSGGTWSGGTWSAGTWSGGTWSGGTWSGGTWSAGTWSGGTWSGGTWSGGTWSGGTWSGGTWSGALTPDADWD
jgi:serine protease AprX